MTDKNKRAVYIALGLGALIVLFLMLRRPAAAGNTPLSFATPGFAGDGYAPATFDFAPLPAGLARPNPGSQVLFSHPSSGDGIGTCDCPDANVQSFGSPMAAATAIAPIATQSADWIEQAARFLPIASPWEVAYYGGRNPLETKLIELNDRTNKIMAAAEGAWSHFLNG